MNNKPYLMILFFAALFCSCDSMVNDLDEDKLPKVTSKLVVECYLSPQSREIEVIVTESQPLFGPSYYEATYIRNARVVLSGEAGQITIPFQDSTNRYVIKAGPFKIEPGKKYTLEVSDGNRQVKASCTVPATSVKIKNYVIEALSPGMISGVKKTITFCAVTPRLIRNGSTMTLQAEKEL
jgi:hypothetical protein